MKRTQENVAFLMPGGKRRFLENNMQAPTACDGVSLEGTDTEMLNDGPQDDMSDKEVVCYGAVSLKFYSPPPPAGNQFFLP